VVLTKKSESSDSLFCCSFLVFECEQLVFLFYVFPVMLVSRNPAVFYDFDLGFMACGHNVVALRPHQTKRKPTAVPSWNSQPPRNIFAIYKTIAAKSRHGD
jgi:hypothetical protein